MRKVNNASRTIVVDRSNSLDAVAVITNGQLDDFLFSDLNCKLPPGTVVKATAERKMPRQGAWIVRLTGKEKGFLRTDRMLGEGDSTLVQVSSYPDQGKLPTVSDRLEFAGRYTIVTESRRGVSLSKKLRDKDVRTRLKKTVGDALRKCDGFGILVRSSAAHGNQQQILDEITRLIADFRRAASVKKHSGSNFVCAAPSMVDRAIANWGEVEFSFDEDDDAFERHGVFDLLSGFVPSKVRLANGGNLVVEPTRALVAIDVNSGSDLSANSVLKTNLVAARELPRQLRIRGLGGQIVVDFAPASKNERILIQRALVAAFRLDRVSTTLGDWTGLGHFEMHRRRERPLLKQWLESTNH